MGERLWVEPIEEKRVSLSLAVSRGGTMCKMYFSKVKSVFVQIANCICPNANCICQSFSLAVGGVGGETMWIWTAMDYSGG